MCKPLTPSVREQKSTPAILYETDRHTTHAHAHTHAHTHRQTDRQAVPLYGPNSRPSLFVNGPVSQKRKRQERGPGKGTSWQDGAERLETENVKKAKTGQESNNCGCCFFVDVCFSGPWSPIGLNTASILPPLLSKLSLSLLAEYSHPKYLSVSLRYRPRPDVN